jgi:hypothetical protein
MLEGLRDRQTILWPASNTAVMSAKPMPEEVPVTMRLKYSLADAQINISCRPAKKYTIFLPNQTASAGIVGVLVALIFSDVGV